MRVLECRIERGAIHGMRDLLAKPDNDIFGVTREDIVTSGRLGGHKLGKPIGDLLVLCLLSGAGMDTGS